MFVVGLTGGIGSGKSTVARLFAKHGITIIDADEIARQLTAPDQPALQQIVAHFGNAILLEDGSLNRYKLRRIIFDNTENRSWLEQLLHPLIRKQMQQRIQAATSAYCIAMIPLLLESTPNPLIQRILVVDTPEEYQIQRVQKRDQSPPTEIASIVKTQINREKRLAAADDVITNQGSANDLIPQVEKLHQLYIKLSKV
ncbi:MAG: dephospho-CoA kinase [Gammaproteobacteria bacterium RIFCSPHIGHO2_12_FULL_41_20]|nr:MAG: dephospho-CoA kinase [Gammaproteobacteria bacterium RIFCSPHIGHO2_12_FULL_41_20]